jgi:hypothetical protein
MFYLELREGKKPVREWTDEFKAALQGNIEACRSLSNSIAQEGIMHWFLAQKVACI